MEWLELHNIRSLLEGIKTSVEELEVTNSNLARVQALGKSLNLTRAFEHPKDATLKLFLSPTKAMAVKVAHDLGLFAILAKSETAVSCEELAAQSGAHPLLVERIMRVLVAVEFVKEHGHRKYNTTLLSKEMTDKRSGGVVDTLFIDLAPAILQTSEFLRKTNYQNPEDHSTGPIQYTYNTQMTSFQWIANDPVIHERFHAYVEGTRKSRPYWIDWYLVQQRILDDYSGKPDDPLIVDIGAGSGRDVLAFKRKFPSTTGRIIIEDLPAVFDDVHHHDLGLEKIGYDGFTPRPIQGARVYFLKFILHEFSDDKCTRVLRNITKVMRKGYSKIIIEEFILPDENAETRWSAILKSVGLTVNMVLRPDSDGPSIIEAEL